MGESWCLFWNCDIRVQAFFVPCKKQYSKGQDGVVVWPFTRSQKVAMWIGFCIASWPAEFFSRFPGGLRKTSSDENLQCYHCLHKRAFVEVTVGYKRTTSLYNLCSKSHGTLLWWIFSFVNTILLTIIWFSHEKGTWADRKAVCYFLEIVSRRQLNLTKL